VKLNALNESILPDAQKRYRSKGLAKILWYIEMFIKIPYGKFTGVKKEGLTYYPEAPFNLSVAAAGPEMSGNMALVMLPIAIILLAGGLIGEHIILTYLGRLCLGIGTVGLLDFLLADPGKYREFKERESKAKLKAQKIEVTRVGWSARAKEVKKMMMEKRIQTIKLPDGDVVCPPWQFRNCGMGGRHTEKEYPESNISMQEMMFIPLCAKNYEEAQMITVALQSRLKEIIEKSEGARVMGIGLEGGLAPYIAKEPGDIIPEQRLWRMAIQAIKDIGFRPGEDVALAFDPALSELSNAYREEFNQPDAVGMYYFWRSEEKVVMSRDQLIDLYKKTVDELPIFMLEDAFAEDDYEGWRLLMKELGDNLFIVGDDIVTTRDSTIEKCADDGLMNVSLIKANQIGTLSETLIAMLVALGKGMDLLVSHRSKSPNDDMEAQIALSANTMGLKAGGGANTERLFKYGSITKIMKELEIAQEKEYERKEHPEVTNFLNNLVITDIIAYEEPTNAGIPSVGVNIYAGIPGSWEYKKILKMTGSTPLGTSAGTGEAIHLVDSTIEKSPLIERYAGLFAPQPDKTYKFKKGIKEIEILEKNDPELSALWQKVQRYDGKGCLNAVSNIMNIIAPQFLGKRISEFKSISTVDKLLLNLELETAIARGKVGKDAPIDERIEIMQRKGNLGMNAILSVSLAMGRLIAHIQGKELWQLLREEMKQLIASTVVAHGGLEIIKDFIPDEKIRKIQSADKELAQILSAELPFSTLVKILQQVEQKLKKENKKLYQVLREQAKIYL
jgi:enolase